MRQYGKVYGYADFKYAVELMNKAADTIEKYYSIGTPEECRAAVEKHRRRKPNTYTNKYCTAYHCPACNYDIRTYDDYCEHCGQAIDWSDTE